MNPLPALNFAALTLPSRSVNNSFTTPNGPLTSVWLIRLNDNDISYEQAVRFGGMFQLIPLS